MIKDNKDLDFSVYKVIFFVIGFSFVIVFFSFVIYAMFMRVGYGSNCAMRGNC